MIPLFYDTPVGQFSTFQNEGGELFLTFKGALIQRPYASLDALKAAVEAQKTGAYEWDNLSGPRLERHRKSPDLGWYDRRAL